MSEERRARREERGEIREEEREELSIYMKERDRYELEDMRGIYMREWRYLMGRFEGREES